MTEQSVIAFEDLRRVLGATGIQDEMGSPSKLADKLMQQYEFATLKDTEQVLQYRDGVYFPGGEAIIKAEVEKLDRNHCSTHICNEVIGHIQRRTYRDREEFDANPHILNLSNGLLDIGKLELKPHTPDYLSRIQLPIRYLSSANCPRILRFLKEVMPDSTCRMR